jgi:hypothetical protein
MSAPVLNVVTPLSAQAAAAVSLLLNGTEPEEVGAAAGLANPEGGGWAPRQLAQLADHITSKLNEAAGLAGRGRVLAAAAAGTGDDEFNDGEEGDEPGWWDPEALARLLCALNTAGSADRTRKADAFIPPADQAALVNTLVSELRWSHGNAADLLWCVHAAQEESAAASDGGGGEGGGPTTMGRVEESAEVALELARPRALRGGGCGWRRADAAALLPRLLPASDWDGRGVAGLSAVKGCALLAAALAAGGRNAVDEDGRGGGGRSERGYGSRCYPNNNDDEDDPGWPVGEIASALQGMLEEDEAEKEEDDEGQGWDGEGEQNEDEASANEREADKDLVDAVARLEVDSGGAGARLGIGDEDGDDKSGGERDGQNSWRRGGGGTGRRSRGGRRGLRHHLTADNSNAVGSVNSLSRRGIAGRGGGGVVRRLPPSVGPDPASCSRPR